MVPPLVSKEVSVETPLAVDVDREDDALVDSEEPEDAESGEESEDWSLEDLDVLPDVAEPLEMVTTDPFEDLFEKSDVDVAEVEDVLGSVELLDADCCWLDPVSADDAEEVLLMEVSGKVEVVDGMFVDMVPLVIGVTVWAETLRTQMKNSAAFLNVGIFCSRTAGLDTVLWPEFLLEIKAKRLRVFFGFYWATTRFNNAIAQAVDKQ